MQGNRALVRLVAIAVPVIVLVVGSAALVSRAAGVDAVSQNEDSAIVGCAPQMAQDLGTVLPSGWAGRWIAQDLGTVLPSVSVDPLYAEDLGTVLPSGMVGQVIASCDQLYAFEAGAPDMVDRSGQMAGGAR
jgi:hypothetical protein